MLRTRIEREQPRLAKLRKVHQNVDKITNFIQNLLIKDPEQRLGRRIFNKRNKKTQRLILYNFLLTRTKKNQFSNSIFLSFFLLIS